MDSPGNDLESIAGQVASGCNVIYFTTGNGSITNFPIVPTIKVVSTSKRYALMRHDMDVDAGEFATAHAGRDAELGEALYATPLRVAAGERTKGEAFGYHQVQVWREWANDATQPPPTAAATAATDDAPLGGAPLATAPLPPSAAAHRDLAYAALPAADGDGPSTTERVALLLPTSLCSSEVARGLATELQRELGGSSGDGGGGLRFVALPHTEGCGNSDEKLGAATLLGHLRSPLVAHALLLEHGCEKTHNDYFSGRLTADGASPAAYGWASLQADGGVQAVKRKVSEWFADRLAAAPPTPPRAPAPLATLSIGLLVAAGAPPPEPLCRLFAHLTLLMSGGGGAAVLPQTSPLLGAPAYCEAALAEAPRATLRCGERFGRGGVHVVATNSGRWVETLALLGAAGVHLVVAWQPAARGAPTGHPMVPMLSLQTVEGGGEGGEGDALADVSLDVEAPDGWLPRVLEAVRAVASGEHVPLALRHGNADFMIQRGGGCSL